MWPKPESPLWVMGELAADNWLVQRSDLQRGGLMEGNEHVAFSPSSSYPHLKQHWETHASRPSRLQRVQSGSVGVSGGTRGWVSVGADACSLFLSLCLSLSLPAGSPHHDSVRGAVLHHWRLPHHSVMRGWFRGKSCLQFLLWSLGGGAGALSGTGIM